MLYLDYTAPIARIREKVAELAAQSQLWDRNLVKVQVTDAKESTMEVRILVSAHSAGTASDLRAEIREKLIDFLQQEYPQALPRSRQEVVNAEPASANVAPRKYARS
jgi:hypothetical protein